jgi:hypothetical protein
MIAKISLALSALVGISISAQQPIGTVVGTTPGSTIGRRLSVTQVQPPPPTCATSAGSKGPTLPGMIFSRMMGDLVCERQPDGSSNKLLGGAPFAAVSPNGNEIAYWVVEKRELHLFATATHTDTVIDSLPGAIMRELIWSRKGRRLSYLASAVEPAGIRAIDFDSGKRSLLPGHFTTLTESPDPDYLVEVTLAGVQRIRLADGKSEVLAAAEFATDASFSPSGQLLGFLVPPPPAKNAPASANAQAEDDSPDCTGGTSILKVQQKGKPGLLEIPFPKGFDSALDFAFSPDDRNIAVTFGAAACDYPGDVARVYVVSVPEMKLTPVSAPDRLSVKPQWSPNGKVIVYSDYTAGDSGLFAVDLQARVVTRVTDPHDNGPDQWIAWRSSGQSVVAGKMPAGK